MQQSSALEILKTGANVFLTGEAGSGKTYVLNQYQDWLKDQKLTFAVTASTGIAATHLGGRTIHSWSGLGIKDQITDEQINRILSDDDTYDRLRGTDVLIVDEISMLSHHQLDSLDRILKAARENPKAFGGIQIILSGDFFQLPPIGREARLAVVATVWTKASFAVCYLDTQYRTTGDSALSELLSAMRNGEFDQQHFEWLQERMVVDPETNETNFEIPNEITRLYTHNEDVDKINKEQLDALPGSEKIFTATHTGDSALAESLVRNSLIEYKLKLKVDAEVMFIKNDPAGKYVNGSRGKVINFKNKYPTVELHNGKTIRAEAVSWGSAASTEDTESAVVRQIPLRLAWAVTVHKSQGLTLDQAAIDLSRVFTPGQGYVALSRLESLSGLYLLGISNQALAINPDIHELDKQLREQSQKMESYLNSHEAADLIEKQKSFVQSRGGIWSESRTLSES